MFFFQNIYTFLNYCFCKNRNQFKLKYLMPQIDCNNFNDDMKLGLVCVCNLCRGIRQIAYFINYKLVQIYKNME